MKYTVYSETATIKKKDIDSLKERVSDFNLFSPQGIKSLRAYISEQSGYRTTQKEFAEMVGVTVHAVESWEQGLKLPDRRSKIALNKLIKELDFEMANN